MPSDEAGPADSPPPAGESSAAAIDTASALPPESLEFGEIAGDQRLRLAKQLLIFVGLYGAASFAAWAAFARQRAGRADLRVHQDGRAAAGDPRGFVLLPEGANLELWSKFVYGG